MKLEIQNSMRKARGPCVAIGVGCLITILPALHLVTRGQAEGRPRPAESRDRAASPGADPTWVPFGFSPESYQEQRRWEQLFLKSPEAERCGRYLKRLTEYPHVAGTRGDRRVARLIYQEFERDGLNPEIVEYRVLLSYPRRVTVELVEPERAKLASPEPEIPGDKATHVRDPLATVPWCAYSPSADITRPVVYVNYGNAEDYDRLEKLGVTARGKIVFARYFQGYRGGKSLEAERRGADGIIVYSDPADDGAAKGKVYPNGPMGPLGHFQRGSSVYDFLVPGDPLTPGWASTPSAKRIAEADARILPKIPMVPVSAADGQEILKRLKGRTAPKEWQGGLPLEYHVGDDSVRVHLDLQMESRVEPIWNVLGRIPGREEPEKLVILSNHHDAWVYGAVDPASGTATMLETARAVGQLLKRGFHPRRTILFGSWDAEEYTLTGSTEWGEQFEDELKKNGVICLNVDASTSGQEFSVSSVPALRRAIAEATQDVMDPATGRTVYDRWREQRAPANVRSYAVPGASAGPVSFGLLGGGSDYMVFLQHDGVPSLDMIFDGPYGVYHSIYDDYEWMARFGDPGFRYHAAMSRLWGLLALRFADAEVLPFDYTSYADEVGSYLESLEKISPAGLLSTEIRPLVEQCRAWHAAAERMNETLEELRTGKPLDDPAATLNAALMAEERTLLREQGIPGRPWFRHLIYAPLPNYEAETLPGLREGLLRGNLESARDQARQLAAALRRATEVLQARKK